MGRKGKIFHTSKNKKQDNRKKVLRKSWGRKNQGQRRKNGNNFTQRR